MNKKLITIISVLLSIVTVTSGIVIAVKYLSKSDETKEPSKDQQKKEEKNKDLKTLYQEFHDYVDTVSLKNFPDINPKEEPYFMELQTKFKKDFQPSLRELKQSLTVNNSTQINLLYDKFQPIVAQCKKKSQSLTNYYQFLIFDYSKQILEKLEKQTKKLEHLINSFLNYGTTKNPWRLFNLRKEIIIYNFKWQLQEITSKISHLVNYDNQLIADLHQQLSLIIAKCEDQTNHYTFKTCCSVVYYLVFYVLPIIICFVFFWEEKNRFFLPSLLSKKLLLFQTSGYITLFLLFLRIMYVCFYLFSMYVYNIIYIFWQIPFNIITILEVVHFFYLFYRTAIRLFPKSGI